MNWQAVNFDWNHLRAFLATAQEGSLSAAARALGQTQPTLGRQIAALEAELGLPLFERVGKRLHLTPTGQELVTHVSAMRDAAFDISRTIERGSHRLEGTVKITASDIFSAYLLPGIVDQLRQRAPNLKIVIVASNDFEDLQRREADIAIRHQRPAEPELTARLIGDATAHLYASETYIARKGLPQTADDLTRHDFIGFGDIADNIGYMRGIGIALTADNYPISSASGLVAWAFARQGMGMLPMSETVAATCPEMRRVLPGMPPIHFPVWLVTHQELHSAKRIRLVFDHLAEGLSVI